MNEMNLDDDVLDDLNLQSNNQNKTPGGLIALCILTLVGSVGILFKDFFTYAVYWEIVQEFRGGFSETFASKIRLAYFIEVLSCVGAISGAILMLLRKKIGFIIWLIACVLYIIEIIWFFYNVVDFWNEGPTFLLLFIYIIGAGVFIPLYAIHTKYLD